MAGFDINDLKKIDYTLKELNYANYKLKELKEAGFTLKELKEADFSALELKKAGFNINELKKVFSSTELINNNFSENELKSIGCKFNNKTKNNNLFVINLNEDNDTFDNESCKKIILKIRLDQPLILVISTQCSSLNIEANHFQTVLKKFLTIDYNEICHEQSNNMRFRIYKKKNINSNKLNVDNLILNNSSLNSNIKKNTLAFKLSIEINTNKTQKFIFINNNNNISLKTLIHKFNLINNWKNNVSIFIYSQNNLNINNIITQLSNKLNKLNKKKINHNNNSSNSLQNTKIKLLNINIRTYETMKNFYKNIKQTNNLQDKFTSYFILAQNIKTNTINTINKNNIKTNTINKNNIKTNTINTINTINKNNIKTNTINTINKNNIKTNAIIKNNLIKLISTKGNIHNMTLFNLTFEYPLTNLILDGFIPNKTFFERIKNSATSKAKQSKKNIIQKAIAVKGYVNRKASNVKGYVTKKATDATTYVKSFFTKRSNSSNRKKGSKFSLF